jgi:5-methyltetrahydrofolate--homocysteine methyltransferase
MELKALFDAVVNGEAEAVAAGVQAALDEGLPAEQILNGTLIPAMSQVGCLFEAKEYYIPEMLLAANAMQAGVRVLKPQLVQAGAPPAGKLAFGTVKGDLHDIGKNLVAMMLEGAGLEVYNLGTDVAPEKFVSEVKARNANILALSALLTTTMPMMKQTIAAVAKAGIRDKVKILIGGAPVTQAYATEIGADGYAPDAGAAVRKAQELVAQEKVA